MDGEYAPYQSEHHLQRSLALGCAAGNGQAYVDRHPISQTIRTGIETLFGDGKQHSTLRQVKARGIERVGSGVTAQHHPRQSAAYGAADSMACDAGERTGSCCGNNTARCIFVRDTAGMRESLTGCGRDSVFRYRKRSHTKQCVSGCPGRRGAGQCQDVAV